MKQPLPVIVQGCEMDSHVYTVNAAIPAASFVGFHECIERHAAATAEQDRAAKRVHAGVAPRQILTLLHSFEFSVAVPFHNSVPRVVYGKSHALFQQQPCHAGEASFVHGIPIQLFDDAAMIKAWRVAHDRFYAPGLKRRQHIWPHLNACGKHHGQRFADPMVALYVAPLARKGVVAVCRQIVFQRRRMQLGQYG